jgi:cation diffusion facilitator CzcD-associated flavoprotein CzcO
MHSSAVSVPTIPIGVDGQTDFDAVVVGAGFGGLYALHRLRTRGLRVRCFEAADDVGGVWYWNRYPGARCDVESMEYSYSFDPALQNEWAWTERYATQPEILAYARHVACRFDLTADITFNTRVTAAHWDSFDQRWVIRSVGNSPVTARFLIMATGCLSVPHTPALAGLAEFAGPVLHTARWPQETTAFSGRRVGVIGNGSTAIQLVPAIAGEVDDLFVFQRTPAYTIPARNRALDQAEVTEVKQRYEEFRAINARMPAAYGGRVAPGTRKASETTAEERQRVFEEAWSRGGGGFLISFTDLMIDPIANNYAAEFVREKIRTIIRDPDKVEVLLPDQVIGCKRPCLDTDYYETFNRDNVHIVNLRTTPITEITSSGIRTSAGEISLDVLVLATGFDAMTGALNAIDIRGRSGRSLRETWEYGPRTYLGLGVAGFPNLFLITGPGSPSVLANMIVAIEHHVDWIAECLDYLDREQWATIEPTSEAEDDWVRYVYEMADRTLYTSCDSWYVGANIPGKQRVFLPLVGGFPGYVERCQQVADGNYEGFFFTPIAQPVD